LQLICVICTQKILKINILGQSPRIQAGEGLIRPFQTPTAALCLAVPLSKSFCVLLIPSDRPVFRKIQFASPMQVL
jgi:hypothetical protein